MGWPCTWWEPTGRAMGYAQASCPSDHITRVELGIRTLTDANSTLDWDDVPWPERCDDCGHVFDFDDGDWQGQSVTTRREWRQPATGELVVGNDLPAGALYDATWYHAMGRMGEDGRALMCVLPNGHHWHIDSRASNCSMPDDDVHRCWCRHGDPTQPQTMTVDKACNTCQAGAGSIQSGDWHGFLRDGALTL